MVRVRPVAVSVAAWSAGVVISVTVGLVALRTVGLDLGAETAMQPLTSSTVGPGSSPTESPSGQPTTLAPTTETASATPSPSTTSFRTANDRWLTSSGGNVLARCGNGLAFLVSWSPAPGYRAEDIVRGPAPTARVTFETTGMEVKMFVTCAGDIPQSTVHKDS
jgi:hypothetical protein